MYSVVSSMAGISSRRENLPAKKLMFLKALKRYDQFRRPRPPPPRGFQAVACLLVVWLPVAFESV